MVYAYIKGTTKDNGEYLILKVATSEVGADIVLILCVEDQDGYPWP